MAERGAPSSPGRDEGREREQTEDELPKHLATHAFVWSLFGVGAGHAVVGRFGWALGWMVARLGGLVGSSMLAAVWPTWSPVALGLGFIWGWVLTVPAAWHARRLARRRRVGRSVAILAGPLFALAGFLALLGTNNGIKQYVLRLYAIPSSSMVPALHEGDRVVAGTGLFSAEPALGQLVFFRTPDDPDIVYVKRVVGMPGDQVEFRDGLLLRNGQAVSHPSGEEVAYIEGCEERVGHAHEEAGYPVLVDARHSVLADMSPMTVPEGHVFVAGDNRDHSRDSRAAGLGPVPIDAIEAHALAVWVSMDPCSQAQVRWDRLGLKL